MFKDDVLKDKVILVTGGGTGLGRSMVERFLELGAKVAISSRRKELLDTVALELSVKYGREVYAVGVDVRDAAAVTNMIEEVWTHFGRIDGLVNNAAGNFISPTERLSPRAVDAVLGIVLHGTFYCTLELGKRWIASKIPGVVLNIATTYASSGSGYVVPSAAAKAGVVAMTKSLAAEWGKYQIRLNAIAPGPFPTEGAWTRLMPTPEIKGLFDRQIPLRRVGEHSELANLASYLMTDYSGFVTGSVFTIDGGESAWTGGEFNVLDEVTPQQWDALEAMRKKG